MFPAELSVLSVEHNRCTSLEPDLFGSIRSRIAEHLQLRVINIATPFQGLRRTVLQVLLNRRPPLLFTVFTPVDKAAYRSPLGRCQCREVNAGFAVSRPLAQWAVAGHLPRPPTPARYRRPVHPPKRTPAPTKPPRRARECRIPDAQVTISTQRA